MPLSVQSISDTVIGSITEVIFQFATGAHLLGEGSITPVSPASYGLQAPTYLGGSGQAVPGGIEAKIIVSGLTLNDRRNADRFLVTSISGLGDADIRDVRDVLPEDH